MQRLATAQAQDGWFNQVLPVSPHLCEAYCHECSTLLGTGVCICHEPSLGCLDAVLVRAPAAVPNAVLQHVTV
jgi:hypothetical protein